MDYDDEWQDEPEAESSKKGQDKHVYQVLPVAELPEDFDGNPTNGSEYLAMMQQIYKDLPFITTAARPKATTASVLKVPDVFSGMIERHPALPKESWEISYTTHFISYKKAVMSRPTVHIVASLLPPSDPTGFASYIYGAKRKKLHISQIQSVKTSTETVVKPIVESMTEEDEEMMMNEQAVAEMMDEKMDEVLAPEVHGDEDREDTEVADEATTTEEPVQDPATLRDSAGSSSYVFEPEEPKHRSKEPSLAIVKAMSQRQIRTLLAHFDRWISRGLELVENPPDFISTQPGSTTSTKGPRVTTSISLPIPSFNMRWIFALLLCLDNDLGPDEMSDLRQLAKTCVAVVRWQVLNGKLVEPIEQEQEDMRMGCWMVVHAIAAAWAQRDLTQDAERIFAKLLR